MSDYDVLIIGSGFGGSVTALRATEKGYRVGVLEAGQRFTDETLPKNSWDLRRLHLGPQAGPEGHPAHPPAASDVLVILAGAGVGGRFAELREHALRAACKPFYDDPQWAHITDWRDELAPALRAGQADARRRPPTRR